MLEKVKNPVKITIAFLLATLGFGCVPSPTPPVAPPVPDATDAAWATVLEATAPDAGDLADRACAKLRVLSCPLGFSPNCPATFRLDPKFGADPACVMAATSNASLAACNVTCQD